MDTIFAVASGHGKVGVSVIRVSGPEAHAVAVALCGDLPSLRRSSVRLIRDASGVIIDQAMVLVFAEGASFTGEPVVEFHLHGSPAVVSAMNKTLSSFSGVRPADPGEFTRRALENQRLDLAQVEGLADLIESETESQRVQAMRVFSGALGDKVEFWREKLIRAASLIEATIDFADEDVPVDVFPEVSEILESVRIELRAEAEGSVIAERLRDGFEVAIIGSPNVGKSTLLNRLAGREAAITSEVAGTTRDVIEVGMDLRGLPVTVLDTAGLRETDDFVEGLGVSRALERAERADIRICIQGFRDEQLRVDIRKDDIVVLGKSDTGNGGDFSAWSGDGVDLLVDRIANVLEKRAAGAGVAIRERHRLALVSAEKLIGESLGLLSVESMPEVAAELLRRGIMDLEAIIGRVDVEDLLDEIFSRFCLGK